MSFADLRLTLPTQGLQSNRDLLALYRDILVDQVIETADFGPKLAKIVPHLHNLNRMPLDGESRRSLTEPLIRRYLLFELQANRTHSIPSGSLDALMVECNREISYATKLILRDCITHSQAEQARFTYWAICALADQLEDFSRQYRSQPGAIWGELHRLFQHARLRGLTEFQSLPPDQGDIESRYKQVLLLAAAQPEHLNRNDQAILTAYLQKWAFRARLNHQQSREGNSRYFYVDLESNQGVQTARRLTVAGNDESILVLNPLPLIEQGRQHMKQVHGGLASTKLGLPADLDSIDVFMTLRNAIAAWRQSGSRRLERTVCDAPAHVAVGLRSIHHYLRLPNHSIRELLNTRTVNQCAFGACIRLDSPAVELSVGDIVIHQEEGREDGRLAVIRWLKQAGSGRFFGVEYITGTLQPVAVRVQERITEALLISNRDSDSLITHKGYCTNGDSIRLKNFRQGNSMNATPQSVVQRGQNVDQIRLKRQAG